MKCGNCGSYIRDDSKFCNYCGIELSGNPTETGRVSIPFPAETAEENTNAADKKEQSPEVAKARPRDEDFNVKSKKPKEETEKTTGKPLRAGVIFIIILAGIIFAVLCNLVYYSMKNNQRTVINIETTDPAETNE